jgi:hypothetical protein
MIGDWLRPVPAIAGITAYSGNTNPLSISSRMNPVDFNETTVGADAVERWLHHPAPHAPVFVVGCGHSGTTELLIVLSRHPILYAYLDSPGMEYAVQPNSFKSSFKWLRVKERMSICLFPNALLQPSLSWGRKRPLKNGPMSICLFPDAPISLVRSCGSR